MLTHFAPFWLAGGIAAAALAWKMREAMTLAAVAVLSSASLMAPEFLAFEKLEPARGETLKIVQFNMWAGIAYPEQTVDWIMAQDPDVVVTEEASPAYGAAMLLSKRFRYNTDCTGKAACSTVIYYNRPPLAEARLGDGPEGPYVAAAWVTLPGPGGPFTVAGTHNTWPYPAGPQQAQSRRLADRLARLDKRSLIVAGDFNSTPWSFSLKRQDKAFGLRRITRVLASWPAGDFARKGVAAPFPFLPIDHVYVGEDWRTAKVERGPRLGSDHYPVVVTLWRPLAPSKAAR